jgi:hypothetical protein
VKGFLSLSLSFLPSSSLSSRHPFTLVVVVRERERGREREREACLMKQLTPEARVTLSHARGTRKEEKGKRETRREGGREREQGREKPDAFLING